MEKIINLIPVGLLSSYIVKMVILTPGFADMGIVAALAAVVGIQVYLDKNQSQAEMKAAINKQNDVIQAMAVEHAKLKGHVEGIKLKEGFRSAAEGMKKVG